MKKLFVLATIIFALALPGKAFAQETETICTQYYGGGVVCGVHTPVDTGIADSLPLIGSMFLGSSGVLLYFSKRVKRAEVSQNN